MLLTELNQCDNMLLKGSSISATLRRTMLLDLEQKTIQLPFWHLKGPCFC